MESSFFLMRTEWLPTWCLWIWTQQEERANEEQEKKEENNKKINKESKKKTGSINSVNGTTEVKRNKLRNSNYND